MEKHFWCADPWWVAEEVSRLWPGEMEGIIQSADQVLAGRFAFQDHWEMERCREIVDFGPDPAGIQWDLVPYGDEEWVFALNRHTFLVNLGKVWLHTRDERYARRFGELIRDWIHRVPLTESSAQTTWRALETGLRCENWLRAMALFQGSGVLTPDLEEEINACLRLHGEVLLRQSGDFQKLSNWGILQDHGLYLLGVWFGNPEWIRLAAQRLDRELHYQIMADGTHWEQSPMYHCEVLHCALDTLLIARRNGLSLPERFTENVHRMCRALLVMLTPDGRLICQGDSDAIDARDLLALGAILFRDGQLRSDAGEIPYPETLWDLGKEAYSLTALAPQSVPVSLALPDSGNVLLRSHTGPDGAYLHFHCGSIGGGHGHADLLHIDAGVGGEPVLIDSGRYTYVDTPLRRALKRPAAHNTTTVDGADFSGCQNTWTWEPIAAAVKCEHRFSETADFVSGHHLGYLGLGVSVGREILWLREWKTAVIFDEFFVGNDMPHDYKQYFHLGKGWVSLNENRLHWQGSAAAAELICLGDVACGLEKAPYSTEYNQLQEGDVLTVSRRQEGFGWFLTVLDLAAERPLRARLVPISSAAGGIDDPHAQAVELIRGDRKAVVMLRCGDAVPPRALLRAGAYEGYGRAILFDQGHPDGLCLAW